MDYLRFASKFRAITLLIGFLILTISCDDGIMDSGDEFQLYGRIVYRPDPGQSAAEFYIFNFNNAVNDAEILVKMDTLFLSDSIPGFYYSEISLEIGDTIDYSINSDFGARNGIVIIPDTVSILNPLENAMINFGEDFDADWNRGANADGYFVYLEYQDGLVADIVESFFDTTITISGERMQNPGYDRIWIESINGEYEVRETPFHTILPRGVVGAAGNFRNVEIVL